MYQKKLHTIENNNTTSSKQLRIEREKKKSTPSTYILVHPTHRFVQVRISFHDQTVDRLSRSQDLDCVPRRRGSMARSNWAAAYYYFIIKLQQIKLFTPCKIN